MSAADPERQPEMDNEENKEETLAERSARLEAEAQAMRDAAQDPDLGEAADDPEPYAETDPLAPASTEELMEGQAEQVIKGLQDQIDSMKEQMMRVAADAENTKRRALREREDARKFAISSFAKDMLGVADNLRRALEAIPEDLKEGDERVQNITGGIEATEREMLRAFEKSGIQKLNPEGEIFNPNLHEVMFETPGTGQPAGTVIQVLEVGYMIHDRLLRPARVGVAKDDGSTPTTDPGNQVDTEA